MQVTVLDARGKPMEVLVTEGVPGQGPPIVQVRVGNCSVHMRLDDAQLTTVATEINRFQNRRFAQRFRVIRMEQRKRWPVCEGPGCETECNPNGRDLYRGESHDGRAPTFCSAECRSLYEQARTYQTAPLGGAAR